MDIFEILYSTLLKIFGNLGEIEKFQNVYHGLCQNYWSEFQNWFLVERSGWIHYNEHVYLSSEYMICLSVYLYGRPFFLIYIGHDR